MNLRAGVMLTSLQHDGSIFDDALLYLVAYDESGAVGVIVNKPYGRALNELHEFRHSPSWPLYNGGPVAHEELFFLHRRPDLIADGASAGDGLQWGGRFSDAVRGINNGALTTADVKLFVGYCGWDAGDLEAEVASGAWQLSEANGNTIF
ncbi:MAG: YqgE/AlgH family protein [Chitinophagaceae bacterium]|nr:MAG: YqgE/AlgH family protein [Chitinophagaceae bacterium]